MKRFTFVLAAAVAATLLLSACDISIGTPPGPPQPDVTLSAPSTSGTAAWNDTLARGESVLFKLSFTAAGSGNVIYLELDKNLKLELNNPTNLNAIASSHGPSYYARGTAGYSTASATDLAPQAIGTATACRGSCIIIPAVTGNTYYARVSNDTDSSVTANLYFYRDIEQDQSEPNGSPAEATFFDMSAAGGDQGAIELLSDADFWRVSATGTLDFSPVTGNPVQLRLAIVNSSGVVIAGPIGPGSISVLPNDIVKVYSLNNVRAGAPAVSRYTLLGH